MLAGRAAAVGVSTPISLFDEEDETRLLVAMATTQAAERALADHHKALANQIISQLAEAMK